MNTRVENYLPIHLVTLGIGFCVAGLIYITTNPVIGLGLILAGLILSTTHHRLEVSSKDKYYREYVWVLGLKRGEKINFNEIKYWYITKSKTSQEYGPVYWRLNTNGQSFNGYLKFNDKENIFIGHSLSKGRLINKIKRINSSLKLDIKDYG